MQNGVLINKMVILPATVDSTYLTGSRRTINFIEIVFKETVG